MKNAETLAVGRRLLEARENMGYSRERLSKESGVPKSTIRGYEKGNSEPTLGRVKRIADALEVTLDWIAYG